MTTGRSLRVGEALLGGGVLALGLFVTLQTALSPVSPTHAAVGPRLFPFLIGGGLIIVGVLVLREAFFGHVAHERGGIELDWRAIAFVSAGLVVQMLLIEWLGWIVAATLLFMAAALAFGSRRLWLDAIIGVVLTGLTFVIFNYGLGLNLPMGTLVEDVLDPEEDAP